MPAKTEIVVYATNCKYNILTVAAKVCAGIYCKIYLWLCINRWKQIWYQHWFSWHLRCVASTLSFGYQL